MKVGDKVKLTREYKRFACSIVRGDRNKRFIKSKLWWEGLLSHRDSIGDIVDVSEYDTVRVVRVKWANGQRGWICLKDLEMI